MGVDQHERVSETERRREIEREARNYLILGVRVSIFVYKLYSQNAAFQA